MSRRHIRMFSAQFADLVQSGKKLQTIRPVPTRARDIPQVGDTIECRAWEGKAYRSKQRRLRTGRVVKVWKVTLGNYFITFPGPEVMGCDDFARADGFRDWIGMRDWFQKAHGLPFTGILTRWEVLS